MSCPADLNPQHTQLLLEATSDILWKMSGAGEVVCKLPGWSAFTGQTYDEAQGRGWLNAIHPDDRKETLKAWAVGLKTRSIIRTEHLLKRHDGAYRYMLVRAVPILNQDGTVVEWLGAHTDITELRRTDEAMAQPEHFAFEYPRHVAEEQRWFSSRATRLPGDGPRPPDHLARRHHQGGTC
jgi:PAS domain S-box-containing protein